MKTFTFTMELDAEHAVILAEVFEYGSVVAPMPEEDITELQAFAAKLREWGSAQQLTQTTT